MLFSSLLCQYWDILYFVCLCFPQLSSKRETCGDKSRQLRDAQQDARDKVEVKKLHQKVW